MPPRPDRPRNGERAARARRPRPPVTAVDAGREIYRTRKLNVPFSVSPSSARTRQLTVYRPDGRFFAKVARRRFLPSTRPLAFAATVEPFVWLTVIRPVTTASPKRTSTVRTFVTVAPFPGDVPSTGAWARAGAA